MNLYPLYVRLYPRLWRARYADEMLAMLEEHPLSFKDTLDLVLGAVDAHLHPALGLTALPAREKADYLLQSLRRSLSMLFCAYIGFVVAGLAFQKLTEEPVFLVASNTSGLVALPYLMVEVGSVVALLAVLAGGLPVLLGILWQVYQTHQFRPLALLAVPPLSLITLVATIPIAGMLPVPLSQILFVSLFLLAAAASTLAVCMAAARCHISGRILRFAVGPALLLTVAMALMLLATLGWGLAVLLTGPALMSLPAGFMGASAAISWARILALMALATAFAGFSLVRSLSLRSVLA